MVSGNRNNVHQNANLSIHGPVLKIVVGIEPEENLFTMVEPMERVDNQNGLIEIKVATKNLENINMEVT